MTTLVAERSRVKAGGLWALQIVSAGMFLLAGSLKLTGNPLMVQEFGVIGLGQWRCSGRSWRISSSSAAVH
jgi:uncharacterized membrane protein YphA (DoxX/SURF4 family)